MTLPPKKWESLGGPVPLFDRLIDLHPDEPEEAISLLNYTKEQLVESIIREASALLNTRCQTPYKIYDEMEPSSLTYGVPELYGLFDSSYADPSRSEDQIKLCRFIATTLGMFDKRLQNIEVTIDKYDQSNQKAYISIKADLKIGKMVDSIVFPVQISRS
ncbi:MAG: type VI secretion system baseplate subunit TssE [Alphaproteobacteria bacterium]